MAGRLELQTDAGGHRYFLEGRPVHAGDLLEVLAEDGHWRTVRFEWTHLLDDPVRFFEGTCEIRLPNTAQFRWPTK